VGSGGKAGMTWVEGLAGRLVRVKSLLLLFVDRMLDRCACMWPMVVASEWGRYCCTCLEVSSGHESRWPALMASIQVERTGEKRLAW
jgi:hypothetical protein